MQKKRTDRRRSVWTPSDIERAGIWWRARRPAPDGVGMLQNESQPPPAGPRAISRTPAKSPRIDPAAIPAPDGTLPVVPAHQSVHSEYVVCMECGQRHRNLAPHLREAHQTDPNSYRRRWSLPTDYSMICPWDRMRR